MAKSDPSNWTPQYRARIERYLAKHPGATLSEARGHKPAPLPSNASNLEKSIHNLNQRKGNLSAREKLGMVKTDLAKEQRKDLNAMARELKKMYEKHVPGTKGYRDSQKKVKKLYDKLDSQRFWPEEAEDRDGEIYYH